MTEKQYEGIKLYINKDKAAAGMATRNRNTDVEIPSLLTPMNKDIWNESGSMRRHILGIGDPQTPYSEYSFCLPYITMC